MLSGAGKSVFRKKCFFDPDANTHKLFFSYDPPYSRGNNRNETDETNCENWICNNTYSRCDGFWFCPNGANEVDCKSSNCPKRHHQCVFPNDPLEFSCLPIEKAGDHIDDSFGGLDERNKYSRTDTDGTMIYNYFHCRNDIRTYFRVELCNQKAECPLNDDEIFCTSWKVDWMDICSSLT